jgi:hypothetical protein
MAGTVVMVAVIVNEAVVEEARTTRKVRLSTRVQAGISTEQLMSSHPDVEGTTTSGHSRDA